MLYETEQPAAKRDSKYPEISASWKAHWSELSTYFKYPQSVRTLIYTADSIENFNRQLRKVSKNRSVFPNDDSLLKMLFLTQADVTGSRIGRRRHWGEIHSQLEIFFADRLPGQQKFTAMSRAAATAAALDMPCFFCYYANDGVKDDFRLSRHHFFASLYRTLDFTHNLKKSL